MDSYEISETLQAANVYLRRLNNLNTQLENAELQIVNTTVKAEKSVEVIFTNLIDNITQILQERRNFLIEELQKVKTRSVKPLVDCQKVISKNLNDTKELIKLANNGVNNIDEFNNKASLLGSLPEVPPLTDVPCISFQYESIDKDEILDLCRKFGSISNFPPVQITKVTEKPGALLVEWQNVDDDRFIDIQEFRLQKTYGDVINNKKIQVSYQDCYNGLDLYYLVKDVVPNQHYTFRVCCKFDGSSEWSTWSQPQAALTKIKPFTWRSNEDYSLTNGNKIAKVLNKEPSILFSDGPQFHTGYSVEFTFLECDADLNNTCIGLFTVEDTKTLQELTNLNSGAFLIKANGQIFIDGTQKSTYLPTITLGSKVCFTSESVGKDKYRINIDLKDKRVTYDCSNESMYFGAMFNSSKWKIMVE